MADMTAEGAFQELEVGVQALPPRASEQCEIAIATLRAEISRLEKDAATGREIAAVFLPVMEAARPLVLNLERLRDAAKGASHD